MQLQVRWQAPIELKSGARDNLILMADGLDEWMEVPGVYIFARLFDNKLFPLYIGKGEKLGKRIWQHFERSTALMHQVRDSKKGSKVLVLGEFTPGRRQNTALCIELIERALIDHALMEGHELLNIRGTRAASHKVCFSGFLPARNLTGPALNFKAEKSR